MTPTPPSSHHDNPSNTTSAAPSPASRSTRPHNSAWSAGSTARQASSRRGLTPISTTSPAHQRPPSASGSPSRAALSPTTLTFSHAAALGASRQVASRQSSTSSNTSLTSPPASGHATAQFGTGSRTRAPTSTGSPRLSSSLASVSSAAPPAGVTSSASGSRFARQSPSLSLSSTTSPVSASGPHSAGGSGQLTSLLTTQLNILLSTLKESNFDAQADKIRSLVDDNGMDVFTTFFRRLLISNASAIFSTSARPASSDNAGQYKLLAEEMAKVSRDPQQAERVAQSLDTNENEVLRDFDLSTFMDHFRLNSVAKVALALPIRSASKPDLRSKADAILTNNFQPFLAALSSPTLPEPDDVSPTVLAMLIERLVVEPPRHWGDEHRESLNYAIRMRYNRLGARIPPPIQSAMLLIDLLDSQESGLARLVQRTGPRGTANLEACKDLLSSAEPRDITYLQVANALLFMISTQNSDYDLGIFVEGLRQHRAAPKIDWTDVVQAFDKDQLRVTKAQFLALYNALSPLAREYANFDIQTLWGGHWQFAETQLSFLVAFLTTSPRELDVTQIHNLRQAFTLEGFAGASESVKNYAVQAVKHPLVSLDATEALFTMIFQSQETYIHAQMLGIPDSIINPNMTIFVCAASAVAKPWAALQEQALKQLFHPFLLKHHDNYDFVMYALWLHDKVWVATRIVEFYQLEPMLLGLIYEHAQEQGWLTDLVTIQSSFAVDLATYAHGKGQFNLEEWAQPHIRNLGPQAFARVILEFMKTKMEDETIVQRERASPQTAPLAIKTVYLLLLLLGDALPDDETGPVYRQCLQTYPRLFNYGEDDSRNTIIDENGAHSNALPDEAGAKMEERYKEMYGGTTNPEQLVGELKRLKVSEDAADQELFAAMLQGLFDEYNCFGEYPNEALATTAVLFGGLIAFNVLSGVAEQAAIYMVFEAVSEYATTDAMYRFGLQAMVHILDRLREWPHLAERILHTPTLRDTQAFVKAEEVLRELQREGAADGNGDVAFNGITNGALDGDLESTDAAQPFWSVHVDSPLRPEIYEDPDDDVSDKVMFVLNNVSKRNFDEKFQDLRGALEDKHHQWFAHYLVEELAKTQINFQGIYLQILASFNERSLWQEVLRETYASCEKMLNAELTMNSASERANLKNLANWLGTLTLARDQPILHRNVSFKDLLIEGYTTERLLLAIPFTCKTLVHAKSSRVFKPPNPWLVELLGVLSELYEYGELKVMLKFEIEVLYRELGLDLKSIPPLEVIRSRPAMMHENNMLQPYGAVDAGPDGFGDMAIMGLSKRAPSERFTAQEIVQRLPSLEDVLQIPQAAGSVTQPQLRTIFVTAAQHAVSDIITPVVERSVTIAAVSAAQMILKDFATELDIEKMMQSAHNVVKSLSGALALVTCKEPLRMSITNNIRILASRSLTDQLPEGQIIMFVNDNIDTVCGLIERAAEEHSLAEIEAQLVPAVEARRRHAAERPNEPFSDHERVSRWAQLIPEPFRQDLNGLNRQQLALYEDFGRQAKITPAQHASNQSQDASRQLPDVLSDTYLPTLTTPAEQPAIPRQTVQQRGMQGVPGGQGQVNGYVDTPDVGHRILELLQDLQQAAREAPEDRIDEIGEDAPIRSTFERLVALVGGAVGVQKDNLAIAAGRQCWYPILSGGQKRLEVEVFVRLLKNLCKISEIAGRQLTIELATMEDDKMFNANVVVALLAERLFDVQHIDMLASRAIKARRSIALPFLLDLLDELLLGDDPLVLRADFVFTYEALGQWLAEDPTLDLGREIFSKLQLPVRQTNGMPSPPQTGKQDQLEYIFEEWVRLQRKDTPEYSCAAFVRQLHENHIIGDSDDAILFWRSTIEMSCAYFERVSNSPWASHAAPYIHIDALAKLVVYIVAYAAPTNGESHGSPAKALDAILRLVVLVMTEHHNKQRERFNARVYFRLFSTLLCELRSARREVFDSSDEQQLAQVLALALQVVQPRHFPGFAYSWLALISHRSFVPALLAGSGRNNGGWQAFVKLMEILFVNLEDMLQVVETPVIHEFYRGVTRFMLVLHHDFPEFLIENSLQLNSSIPILFQQLFNIVNSAVTRATINDQPDPFTAGLKINRLDQVRQQPPISPALDDILESSGLKEPLDRICSSSADNSSDEAPAIISILNSASPRAQRRLINALVLYIGVRTTAPSSAFSAAAPPARLLELLLREYATNAEVRYSLVCALVNNVRYVNAHTHYFTTALQHFFTTAAEEVQQCIMRAIWERLSIPRPHPWGLIVMVLELLKNPSVDVFQLNWMKMAPQVESMLASLAHSQERMGRS